MKPGLKSTEFWFMPLLGAFASGGPLADVPEHLQGTTMWVLGIVISVYIISRTALKWLEAKDKPVGGPAPVPGSQ